MDQHKYPDGGMTLARLIETAQLMISMPSLVGKSAPAQVRAAGYYRIGSATPMNVEKLIGEQRSKVTDFCEMRGWKLSVEWSDLGHSKLIEHFRTFSEDAVSREAEINVVVVVSHSRISRDLIEAQRVLREFGEHGVRVITIDDEHPEIVQP